jgi:hypothetical protein
MNILTVKFAVKMWRHMFQDTGTLLKIWKFESSFVKISKKGGRFFHAYEKFLDISSHIRKPVLTVQYILFMRKIFAIFVRTVHPSCHVLTSLCSFVHSGEVFMYRGAER